MAFDPDRAFGILAQEGRQADDLVDRTGLQGSLPDVEQHVADGDDDAAVGLPRLQARQLLLERLHLLLGRLPHDLLALIAQARDLRLALAGFGTGAGDLDLLRGEGCAVRGLVTTVAVLPGLVGARQLRLRGVQLGCRIGADIGIGARRLDRRLGRVERGRPLRAAGERRREPPGPRGLVGPSTDSLVIA